MISISQSIRIKKMSITNQQNKMQLFDYSSGKVFDINGAERHKSDIPESSLCNKDDHCKRNSDLNNDKNSTVDARTESHSFDFRNMQTLCNNKLKEDSIETNVSILRTPSPTISPLQSLLDIRVDSSNSDETSLNSVTAFMFFTSLFKF
ncbi:hypothetical protein GJ496_008483 [Pomphorhynchus laevis]|nr:hypothetical protein GJ496_008483 [Pomphorhynchus laevis]